MLFCSCDLDLDPKTLIYELDLDILKIYLHFLGEVGALQTDRHTADVTENITMW